MKEPLCHVTVHPADTQSGSIWRSTLLFHFSPSVWLFLLGENIKEGPFSVPRLLLNSLRTLYVNQKMNPTVRGKKRGWVFHFFLLALSRVDVNQRFNNLIVWPEIGNVRRPEVNSLQTHMSGCSCASERSSERQRLKTEGSTGTRQHMNGSVPGRMVDATKANL